MTPSEKHLVWCSGHVQFHLHDHLRVFDNDHRKWLGNGVTHPSSTWVSGQQLSERFQNNHQELNPLLSDLGFAGCHAMKETRTQNTCKRKWNKRRGVGREVILNVLSPFPSFAAPPVAPAQNAGSAHWVADGERWNTCSANSCWADVCACSWSPASRRNLSCGSRSRDSKSCLAVDKINNRWWAFSAVSWDAGSWSLYVLCQNMAMIPGI